MDFVRAPAEEVRVDNQQVAPEAAATVSSSVIQTKLVVGSSGDPAEADADRIAADVMRRLRAPLDETQAAPFAADQSTRIRRSALSTPIGADGGPVDADVHREIAAERSGGRPMEPRLQRTMESAFGADFSAVRMHLNERSDQLNSTFQASAFTLGRDVHVRRSDYSPTSADGRRLIAHELAHTVQQGAAPSAPQPRVQRMARSAVATSTEPIIRREDTVGSSTTTTDTKTTTDTTSRPGGDVSMALLKKNFDAKTKELSKEMTAAFGVKGMSWRDHRSPEAIAWRQALKDAIREQGREDVDAALLTRDDAEAAWYRIAAKKEVYADAKVSLKDLLEDRVEDLVISVWQVHEDRVMAEAVKCGEAAAWEVLKADPTSKKLRKQAQSAAEAAALAKLRASYVDAQQAARDIKHKIVNNKGPGNDSVQPASLDDLEQAARDKATHDRVGERAVEHVIEADSVESGIGVFGKLLDQVVGSAGDSVSLSVEIKVPIMSGPGYVSFALTGKAARGREGAMTAGVPTFGDPRRLEVFVEVAFNAGLDLIGIDLNAGLKFMVRGGADSTALCMKALEYGAYRSLAAVSDTAANWWAGKSDGVEEGKAVRAETWAAMIEKQAFMNGGGYVDIGAGLGIAGNVNAGVVEAGGSGGVSVFSHYDKAALQQSLGKDEKKWADNPLYEDKEAWTKNPLYDDDHGAKAVQPMTKAEAQARRAKVSSQAIGEWNVAAEVKAELPVLGSVTFAGSLSGPMEWNRWGFEATATLAYSGGTSETLAKQWGAGCATAIAGVVKAVIGAKKAKVGGALAGAEAATQIVNSGLGNAITNGLGQAWEVGGSNASRVVGSSAAAEAVKGLATESTLQVAVILGYDGEAVIARLEIRSGRKLDVNMSLAGAGVKVSAEKSSTLFAVGRDKDGWDVEGFGIRARARPDQSGDGKHRT